MEIKCKMIGVHEMSLKSKYLIGSIKILSIRLRKNQETYRGGVSNLDLASGSP